MIFIILIFNFFGLTFLFLSDFENSFVMFFSNLIFILGYLFIKYMEYHTNTNQFIDGQQTAIEQYNEETNQ